MVRLSDIVQSLGPISSQPEADVDGVLRGAEKRDALGEQLRSLAHPEWPYVGTGHVWRGFVKKEWPYKGVRVRKLREGELEAVRATIEKIKARRQERENRYQKLNFGRLD